MKVTTSTKPISATAIVRGWHFVDMKKQTLGRVANVIAKYLQGKGKVNYAPYLDAGDYVVVVNSKKATVTGRKNDSKMYSYYSGYPNGLRTINFKNLQDRNPNEIIRHAVSGMLPKNKLRDKRLARLYIFPDEQHPYADKIKK